MATEVFFFAEADLLEAQTSSDDAFGPITNNNPELNFRVTSIHRGIFPQQSSIRATPAAFAVCNGRLRVQLDNFNPNLLSIVLAPDENILPGVPIRYFVYHGIRKDSLMTGNSLLQTPLTSHLGNSNTNPFFVPDSVGLAFRPLSANPPSIDFAREDTDPIQSLFFETSTVKPIIVKAGENLGLFDGEAFGIDIILETQWEDAPLSIVRNFETSSANDNNLLIDEGFMAKTGDGHLRGSPNAHNACGVEYQFKMIRNKEIRDALTFAKDTYNIVNWANPMIWTTVNYCFLNLEDAKIQ